jgi:hypothetical protein
MKRRSKAGGKAGEAARRDLPSTLLARADEVIE